MGNKAGRDAKGTSPSEQSPKERQQKQSPGVRDSAERSSPKDTTSNDPRSLNQSGSLVNTTSNSNNARATQPSGAAGGASRTPPSSHPTPTPSQPSTNATQDRSGSPTSALLSPEMLNTSTTSGRLQRGQSERLSLVVQPSTFVPRQQSLPPLETNSPNYFPGYCGFLDRVDAEQMLDQKAVGTFLIRWSDTKRFYVISYVEEQQKIQHMGNVRMGRAQEKERDEKNLLTILDICRLKLELT
jgi:hypothetical protein